MNSTTLNSLPIDQEISRLVQLAFEKKPLILMASPGSGKTTRFPAALLKEYQNRKMSKKIIVLVPKRLAAVAASDRIAEENNWVFKKDVGYQVRFESAVEKSTQLIFMTEGFFLKKIQSEDFINSIGHIILDEFHERSANIDLILGLLYEKYILDQGPQIIVMSATLNTKQLENYFTDSHLIHIEQKPFPLKIIYHKNSQSLICDDRFFNNLKTVTIEAWKNGQKDLLIFLPGQAELRRALNSLKPIFVNTQIEMIYGSMKLSDQKRVLIKTNFDRRIILATNIAESSITLPDLDTVIDSGLEKTISTEKKMGFSKLELSRISQFSARQRAGRSARTNPGFCYRLWHESDDKSMAESKKPEILTSSLLSESLILYSLGIKSISSFSWLDQPSPLQIQQSTEQLKRWGLIDENLAITLLGQKIQTLPLEIPQAILFYQLYKGGFCNLAALFFSLLESTAYDKWTNHAINDQRTDLDKIFEQNETEQTIKIKTQLLNFGLSNIQSADPLNENLEHFYNEFFKIFIHYFPERIVIKKSGINGLSASGRGIEYSLTSASQFSDYALIISAFEKNNATTKVNLAFGYTKAFATEQLKPYFTFDTIYEFNEIKNTFFKKEVTRFKNFIIKESSPQTVSDKDIDSNWKILVEQNPIQFLNLNENFKSLKEKILFLYSKDLLADFMASDPLWLENSDVLFAKELLEKCSTFNEFKTCDLSYYLMDTLPASIQELLHQLPNTIELPSKKRVAINYTDPKAPLISAKIQDCFGWKETPTLLSGRLKLTLELLAPNMRPAQITGDLAQFWNHSYFDVRKELKARYPKHYWPDDPANSELPKRT